MHQTQEIMLSNHTTHVSNFDRASGQTPQRKIRIPDELYYPAVAKAKAEGTTLARVLERFLAEYLAE